MKNRLEAAELLSYLMLCPAQQRPKPLYRTMLARIRQAR